MSGDHPTGYATPEAMWSAVVARSKNVAKRAGPTAQNLTRQFVYDRFLARLFTYAGSGEWVLKGGTALLARVRTARHSRDIDLFRGDGTLDSALRELEQAAAVDLRDHLRFVLGASRRTEERPGQPGSELARVKIDGYAGVRLVSEFVVDIVLSAVITGDPESRRPEAIDAERAHRALPTIAQWDCPDEWATTYAKVARDVAECRDHRSFSSASALAGAFLDPIHANEVDDDATWSPSRLRWEP